VLQVPTLPPFHLARALAPAARGCWQHHSAATILFGAHLRPVCAPLLTAPLLPTLHSAQVKASYKLGEALKKKAKKPAAKKPAAKKADGEALASSSLPCSFRARACTPQLERTSRRVAQQRVPLHTADCCCLSHVCLLHTLLR
jgi:hypothetical protein